MMKNESVVSCVFLLKDEAIHKKECIRVCNVFKHPHVHNYYNNYL